MSAPAATGDPSSSSSPPPNTTTTDIAPSGPPRLTPDQLAAKRQKWLQSQAKRWGGKRRTEGGGVDMGKVVRPLFVSLALPAFLLAPPRL